MINVILVVLLIQLLVWIAMTPPETFPEIVNVTMELIRKDGLLIILVVPLHVLLATVKYVNQILEHVQNVKTPLSRQQQTIVNAP